MAAIFRACLTRLADGLVLAESTLPPLIFVPGHKPSHEQKCLTLAKRPRSGPISDKIFFTAPSPRPLIRVRSTPAQLASVWRASNSWRSLLVARGALPRSTWVVPRSLSKPCSLASHSSRCRAMSSYIASAWHSTNTCSSRQLPVRALAMSCSLALTRTWRCRASAFGSRSPATMARMIA